MFTYPYEILKRRLTLEVTELREIDWYLNQDSTTDKNTWLYTAPLLFIEFLPSDMVDHGNKMQSSKVEFNLHLLTENVMDSGKRMKKDQPSDHMRIYDKVYKAIQGFSSKISYLPEFVGLLNSSQDQRVMNSITRIGQTPPHQIRKAMMKTTQRFKCVMYDHAACKQYTLIAPPATLEVTSNME